MPRRARLGRVLAANPNPYSRADVNQRDANRNGVNGYDGTAALAVVAPRRN
jgi:hypothetical protein